MSSRKMSLLGWRPARVTSLSRAYFDPALGPRLTTSIAAPSERSRETESSSSVSPAPSTGRKVMVVSSLRSGSSNAPHDEQKLASSVLRCPHWLQNTMPNGSARAGPGR